MLDHDVLSFSLVPFCYRVCPFVNQLHPLPSATSGIPDVRTLCPYRVIWTSRQPIRRLNLRSGPGITDRKK